MDEQVSVSAQSPRRDAPAGLFPNVPRPAATSPIFSTAFRSAPRGPRRAGVDGAGARSAAERFGLNWNSASASVRAVAAEACARVPEEWEIEGPGICLSLGDATDLDPALLAAMLGPDGLGGQVLGPQFAQGNAADALRPTPILAALTEQAVADAAHLTDDQLTGALQAARRLEARAAWQQTTLIAEFGRRRDAQHQDAKASGIPKGRRPGEFPDDELAAELLVTGNQAAALLEASRELTTRLPCTYAGLGDGTISADRADTIAAATGFLSDADAAAADEVLAAAAPGLRVDQLARRAAALEMKLDPEATRIRREHAKATRQRVEVRREQSGNASLSGRELDVAAALASKAYIDALAVKVRNLGGLEDSLSSIRARVLLELTQGRDPLRLIKPGRDPGSRPAVHPVGDDGASSDARLSDDYPCCPGDPGDPGPGDADSPCALGPDDRDGLAGSGYAGPDGRPSWDADEAENARYAEPDDPADRRGPLGPGITAPLPASINLLVPIGALLSWSNAPAHANGIGLLDPAETQALVQAASQHPRTRWCATVINPDGTAAAHACARGQHPWTSPPTPARTIAPPGTAAPGGAPDTAQRARLHQLLTELNLAPTLIARSQCDHQNAEPSYTPSRKLKHLLRARAATCDAPGCNAQAVYCDVDHTTPWPDGPTDECNLAPRCRRHHRCKQAPGWHVDQPQPGTATWTLPNGRTHTTTPTVYDL